jgi:hypothetical protein
MADDSRWEKVRVLVGIGLVVLCGLALWRNSVRPLVEKGIGGGDLVREVRLGVYRLAWERKKARIQKEEAEKKKAASEKGGEGAGVGEPGKAVSGGTVAGGTVEGGSR